MASDHLSSHVSPFEPLPIAEMPINQPREYFDLDGVPGGGWTISQSQFGPHQILFSEVRTDEFGRRFRGVLYQLPVPECATPLSFYHFLAEDLEHSGPGWWVRARLPGERYPRCNYAARIPYPCSQEDADNFLRRIERHVDTFLFRIQQQIAA